MFKRKSWGFLPQFRAYKRHKTDVKLEMDCLPVRLAARIGNSAFTQAHGHQVILLLLKGLQSLKDAKVYCRGIHPNRV